MKRYPVLAYFFLTFAISWGGTIVALAFRGGIPRTKADFEAVLPWAIGLMIVGPAIAGLTMTALVDGATGLRELRHRVFARRVAFRWYAIALLGVPMLTAPLLLVLARYFPSMRPGFLAADDVTSRLIFALTAGAVVGVCEELGWTGFATPALRRRHSVAASGLIIGVVWGAWHILGQVVIASGTYTGDLPAPLFFTLQTVGLLFGSLPAFRVLMVWVHDRTDSVAIAMLMHMSLTTTTLAFEPVGIGGWDLFAYGLVWNVVWWLVAAGVLLRARRA